jgi:hypothetical protein
VRASRAALTWKRSEVQSFSRPPHKAAGQSAAGPQPAALATRLGRVGAARTLLRGRPAAFGRSAGVSTTADRGRLDVEDPVRSRIAIKVGRWLLPLWRVLLGHRRAATQRPPPDHPTAGRARSLVHRPPAGRRALQLSRHHQRPRHPGQPATANPRGLNGASVAGLLALLGAGTAAATWELTGLRRRRRLRSL